MQKIVFTSQPSNVMHSCFNGLDVLIYKEKLLLKQWLDALPEAANKSYTVKVTARQKSIQFTSESKLHKEKSFNLIKTD